jgi:hypothetical protein
MAPVRYTVQVEISGRWMTIEGAETLTGAAAARVLERCRQQGGIARLVVR